MKLQSPTERFMFELPGLVPLTADQNATLTEYGDQLALLNRQFNLVSRESSQHIPERHILHSLSIATRRFRPGSTVVDWGTGGGLPGIPLAICFPEVSFVLVDSIGKKVRAVNLMIRRLGLHNVEAVQTRAEDWGGQADYAVSRATAPLSDLWTWFDAISGRKLTESSPDFWEPGLICLKGGNLDAETAELRDLFPGVTVESIDLFPLLKSAYFQEKKLITVQP